jgi:hypothetical protein
MRRQANKHRSERSFSVGEWVFLKLQPYVQSSVARRAYHKLSFKFFGPFKVLQRVGAVAYKLALPPAASIHPVFHVSQLKSSPGANQVTSMLPNDLALFQVPEQILQRRWTSGEHPVEQVYVKWSHMPASLATWEAADHLRELFPFAPAWGHVASQDRGNVSTSANQEGSSQDQPREVEQAEKTSPGRRRTTKPNTRYYGPDWFSK